ncbi:MAG TPA: glycosyltransferase family 2 protein [Candidatus Nanoarchaeia archaeon]|nr:glycosyltransferase family 2 protein [Candidatus Nanoarchaeia archaeon]
MRKISIVLPAYNEEKNIMRVIKQCKKILEETKKEGEIIVVNDGSKDNTKEILNELKKEMTELKVINHNANEGYGKAVADGIKVAKGEYIVTLDSDNQFNIEELNRLLQKIMSGYDIVAGYREKKKDSILRVFANKVLNNLVWLFFLEKFKDINCSFRLYNRKVFDNINMEARSFVLPTEILLKAKTKGFRIAEVEVSHKSRERGRSSIKLARDAVQTLLFLIYLKKKIKLYKKKIIIDL